MARELLLEIGVEEIPSAYMPQALEDLKNIALRKFSEARLKYADIVTYGTARRITLYVKDLNEQQEDSRTENRGPKKSIALDVDGKATKAGLGFARGQGVEFKDLEIREIEGIEYLFAVKKEKGIGSEEILPDVLTGIIQALSFPKSMRWAYSSTRFARPIRWLVAIYGDKRIEINIENIRSANYTFGHRFLSLGPVGICNVDDYFRVMDENFVVLDQQKRKSMIWEQVVEAARAAGGIPMINEELLEEINYLVEYPTAFYGEFSPSYLDVPPEVLTTSMIEHQRYFPVFDGAGKLLPGFIGVKNGTAFSLDVVKAGNERVLRARLEDALFFWKEDTKKPLADMAAGLKDVLFHERLGTIMDKVERLQKLAVYIGKEYEIGDEQRLNRAAYLCKADLVSSMVFEFPELQGIMGRYYALHSQEDAEVSQAVLEHYLPRFAGDRLPASATGKVLSLTEKIDNLVGCFCIGIRPSGSQDPYALRRQALGIVNILIDSEMSMNLSNILGQAYESFKSINPDVGQEDTVAEVLEFIRQRMRGILLDRGYSYDVVDAVLALAGSDLNDILIRVDAVQEFKKSDHYENYMVVYNRAHNLSKNWPQEKIDLDILTDDSEKELYQSLSQVRIKAGEALQAKDYPAAMSLLAGLRPSLDQFFAAVMVMVEDQELKASRLGMLKSIANLCNKIADFSKIV